MCKQRFWKNNFNKIIKVQILKVRKYNFFEKRQKSIGSLREFPLVRKLRSWARRIGVAFFSFSAVGHSWSGLLCYRIPAWLCLWLKQLFIDPNPLFHFIYMHTFYIHAYIHTHTHTHLVKVYEPCKILDF